MARQRKHPQIVLPDNDPRQAGHPNETPMPPYWWQLTLSVFWSQYTQSQRGPAWDYCIDQITYPPFLSAVNEAVARGYLEQHGNVLKITEGAQVKILETIAATDPVLHKRLTLNEGRVRGKAGHKITGGATNTRRRTREGMNENG